MRFSVNHDDNHSGMLTVDWHGNNLGGYVVDDGVDGGDHHFTCGPDGGQNADLTIFTLVNGDEGGRDDNSGNEVDGCGSGGLAFGTGGGKSILVVVVGGGGSRCTWGGVGGLVSGGGSWWGWLVGKELGCSPSAGGAGTSPSNPIGVNIGFRAPVGRLMKAGYLSPSLATAGKVRKLPSVTVATGLLRFEAIA